MNFNNISKLLNNILDEGIADIKRYFPKIEDSKIRELISLDPTYKNNENLGTYGRWILSIYNKGNLKEEDFYKVTEYLQEFEDNKKKFANKDIFQFKTLPDLAKALDDISGKDLQLSHRQQQRELKRQGMKDARMVYEDDSWQIWIPDTYEASCKLGAGTKWCTAYTENSRYYDSYAKDGTLYIIINKEDPSDKYQFHFESNSFMDSYDSSVNLKDFLDDAGGVAKYFATLAKDNPKILENAPMLFFYEENHTDEEISDFLHSLDSDLSFSPETKMAVYSQNVSDFIDNVVYSGGYRDELSPDTVTKIITGETEIFYDIDVTYDDIARGLDDLGDYADKIEEELSKIDLTLEEIRDYFESKRDYDVLDELMDKSGDGNLEELMDEISSRARNAYESGAMNEAYNDIMGDLKREFHNLNYDGEKISIEIPIDEVKDTVNDDYFEEESFLPAYVTSSNDGDLIKLYEPRYGWSGFDKDYFADEIYLEIKHHVDKFLKTKGESPEQQKLFKEQ